MILYHITQDVAHDGHFIPRIPTNRLEGEDGIIPRICASTTIEGCLSSMPGGGMGLENHIHESLGIYKIFKIDTDKYKLKYMNSSELICKELVMDAEITGEYWILDEVNVKPNDTYYIHLEFWREDLEGYTSKELLDTLREKAMSIDEYVNDDDFDDRLMSEVTMIHDLIFTSSLTKKPICELFTEHKIPLADILNLIPGIYAYTNGFDVNVVFNETLSVGEVYQFLGRIKGNLTEIKQERIGEGVYLSGQNKTGKLLAVVGPYMGFDFVWAIILDDGSIVYEKEVNLLKNIA